MKKFSVIFGRVIYTVFFVLVQFGSLALVLRFFQDKFVLFYGFGVLLSVLIGLHVLNSEMNPAYKIA